MHAQASTPLLADILWRPSEASPWWRRVVLAVLGVALITASAKIKVPMYPVPMTMQTFVILVLAMAYGARLGAATIVSYLALGAMGAPVFAGTPEKGIGLAYMTGPTGGYLLGFLLATCAVAWLARRGWDRNVLSAGAAMLAGTLLIYVPGVAWLGSVVGWDKPVLAWGMTPFLAGDAVKVVLAALSLPLVWRSIGRSGGKHTG